MVSSQFGASSVAELAWTNYGRLLLLKVALFLVMLAIAGVNRIVLTPRLSRAHGQRSSSSSLPRSGTDTRTLQAPCVQQRDNAAHRRKSNPRS